MGFYELSLEIFDKQGLACKDKQKLQVEVCTCEGGSSCDLTAAHQRGSSAKVGFPAIGALIGALILFMCELNQRQIIPSFYTNHHCYNMHSIQDSVYTKYKFFSSLGYFQ